MGAPLVCVASRPLNTDHRFLLAAFNTIPFTTVVSPSAARAVPAHAASSRSQHGDISAAPRRHAITAFYQGPFNREASQASCAAILDTAWLCEQSRLSLACNTPPPSEVSGAAADAGGVHRRATILMTRVLLMLESAWPPAQPSL